MGGNKRKWTEDRTSDRENSGSLAVVLDDKAEPPFCDHGPTVLFRRESSDATKCFYACSAYRDRKSCPFFLWKNSTVSKSKLQEWKDRAKKNVTVLPTFDDIVGGDDVDAFYFCHTCSELSTAGKLKLIHSGHVITEKLSKLELRSPTSLLSARNESKQEAQFHFSSRTVDTIVQNLTANGLSRIVCIGAPKIHEKIRESDRLESLLLDFDPRLSQFFGKNEFCRYNMFNHHFFGGHESKEVYLNFLKNSDPGNLVVITDPPFGGRCELISQTFNKIRAEFCEVRKVTPEQSGVHLQWIFPYYMERQIKLSLPEVEMSDYQVSYLSDSGYRDGKEGSNRKQGSPVRIFTTIDLSKIDLSGEPGYKFCTKCNKWVSELNKHCEQCRACTCKNGAPYKHCRDCGRCVKESWIHCNDCNRCTLPGHQCGGMKTVGPNQTPALVSKPAQSLPAKKVKKAFHRKPKKFFPQK